MELTIDKRKMQIDEEYGLNLSFWDFVFWQNNPIQVNDESLVGEQLEKLADMDLSSLYARAQNPDYFAINSVDNPEIDRYFDSEIKALRARGVNDEINDLMQREQEIKQELAQNFGTKQHEEYKHLVDYFAGTDYPKTFQWLLLNETLKSTYRMDFSKGEPKLIVNARKPHQTILGMMNLPEPVVKYIYENGADYTSFKKLYTAAQVEYQQLISRESGITFDNVDTFGMGQWIKFEGKNTDPQSFENNVAKLKALVANTPWCTATLASTHLEQGDFYVFVDNENEPHIAVKMNGPAIDEVRGVQNGNAQELEPEYRDVAINFLENNKEIENGKDWLAKEERNARLVQYKNDIDAGTFDTQNVGTLIQDVYFTKEYRNHFAENSLVDEIKARKHLIVPQIAEYYGYEPEEVYLADLRDERIDKNIKMIFGNVSFDESWEGDNDNQYLVDMVNGLRSRIADERGYQANIENVEVIVGNLHLGRSSIKELTNLKEVLGNVSVNSDSPLNSLGSLTKIGGKANFYGENLTDLGALTTIGGDARFWDSQVTDLGNLTSIGGNADFMDSQVTDLGNLTTIGGGANFAGSKVTNLGNLTTIGGYANFGHTQMESLGNLQTIGGDVSFKKSKIKNLGSLTSIGRTADFMDSQVTDLGKLTTIGGSARFGCSQITDLGELVSIGGTAYFVYSQVTDLGNLEKVGAISVKEGQIIDLRDAKVDSVEMFKNDPINDNTTEVKLTPQEYKEYCDNLLAEQSVASAIPAEQERE